MSTDNIVRIPVIRKVEYEVADIDENDFVNLIGEDGSSKIDLTLPADDE